MSAERRTSMRSALPRRRRGSGPTRRRRLPPLPESGPAAPQLSGPGPNESALEVLRNRRFLALWLAQLATQVGGNMVLYGLTIRIFTLTESATAVSLLLLSFLVPAVVFSAIAGVYVDRLDRRMILIVTNVLRAAGFVVMFVVGDQLALIYLLTILVSTGTTFFTPAESAMIPVVVERRQLLAANGIFVFTLQASFAVGFALLGPLVVNLAGTDAVILLVAVLYLIAGALCMVLPTYAPARAAGSGSTALEEAEHAVASTLGQLRDGLEYVRSHRSIRWTLTYLAITASLIGVLGVLGPAFASQALNLTTEGFVVVVLPLAAGLVMGILALNVYGKYVSRRRVIEGGLVTMAAALAVLAIAGWGSRGPGTQLLPIDLGPLVSLLSVVVALAFVLGVAYAFVAVPAQTQLQEELPADVRGRVFGVLNMLVSIASFLPIIVVGPVADLVGTPLVIMACALLVGLTGLVSVLKAHPPIAAQAAPSGRHAPADPVAVTSVPLSHPVDLWPDDTSTEADGLAADLPRGAEPGRPEGGSSSTR